ncbi:hypothetical protein [uncultured Anaerovibrio sp.]|uniref:hypothetical protein n=1 Tax=uncultured Anaerovibrio sp. TaxID=361586 RepID=UPI002639B519|nr:hypothetical protein [uncultured Anaerovibrio sp.]
MFKKKFDIRDIACDGWGFTAEIAALNKLSSESWNKLVEEWKERLKTKNKAAGSNRLIRKC